MNRLGHAESYAFTLELETALAKTALDQASGVLPTQIVRNPAAPSTFHSDIDNYDQFIDEQSGGGSTHTGHGRMLQELEVMGECFKSWRSVKVANQEGASPLCHFFQGVATALMIVPLKKICLPVMSIDELVKR